MKLRTLAPETQLPSPSILKMFPNHKTHKLLHFEHRTLAPTSQCSLHVVGFPSALDADRYDFLFSLSHPEGKGWEKSSPQQRGGETGEAKL